MKAELIKIYPLKTSRDGQHAYQRIGLKLDNGDYAMTDLVSGFRNYARWKLIIEKGIGTMIDGVMLKSEGKVNADSVVSIIN